MDGYRKTGESFYSLLRQKRWQTALSLLFILLITFLTFKNLLGADFTNWDDNLFVTDNPLIKSLSWENIKIIFTTFYKEDYLHPLVLLSYSLEYKFFQLDPFYYHLDNLILHLMNTVLVYWFVSMLSRKAVVALVVTLLFGIHPLQAESVAWISERKGLLATFFFLQASIYYLLSMKGKRGVFFGMSLVAFVLALLSKAVAVIFPLTLLLYDYYLHRKIDKQALLEKVPFFLISAVYAADTLFMHEQTGQLDHAQLASPFKNFLLACRNIVLYIKHTVWPTELSAVYPFPKEVSVFLPEFFLPIVILGIIVALLFWTRRYTRTIIFGCLFLLVALLPVVQLVPFASGGSVMSDRYMYHSSIGLFFIAGYFVDRLYRMEGASRHYFKVVAVVIVGIVLLLFSSMTYQRNKVWQNSEALWSDVVNKYPSVSLAHYNLGLAYYESGRLDEAIEEYKEAVRLRQHYLKARYNLGLAYAYSGQYDKALVQFQQTIGLDPDHVGAHMSLGRVYQELGLGRKAVAEYREVLRVAPDRADMYNNIGELHMQEKSYDKAVDAFREALRIKPDYKKARENLSRAFPGG